MYTHKLKTGLDPCTESTQQKARLSVLDNELTMMAHLAGIFESPTQAPFTAVKDEVDSVYVLFLH